MQQRRLRKQFACLLKSPAASWPNPGTPCRATAVIANCRRASSRFSALTEEQMREAGSRARAAFRAAAAPNCTEPANSQMRPVACAPCNQLVSARLSCCARRLAHGRPSALTRDSIFKLPAPFRPRQGAPRGWGGIVSRYQRQPRRGRRPDQTRRRRLTARHHSHQHSVVVRRQHPYRRDRGGPQPGPASARFTGSSVSSPATCWPTGRSCTMG